MFYKNVSNNVYEITVWMNMYFTREDGLIQSYTFISFTSVLWTVYVLCQSQAVVSLREEALVLSLCLGAEPSTPGHLINITANNIIPQRNALTEV